MPCLAPAQENKLSFAILENQGDKDMNPWNTVEHQLAVARRVANLNQLRISRVASWLQLTTEFSEKLHGACGKPVPECLGPAAEYRPPVKELNYQVLAVKGAPLGCEEKVVLAVTLGVFRGSICRKGPSQGQVKTGRMVPDSVPASGTKVLHAARLNCESEEAGVYWAACTSRPLIFEPANVVLGEMPLTTQQCSKHRLHVQLTPAASASMQKMLKMKLPEIPAEKAAAEQPAQPYPADVAEKVT